MQNLKTIEEKIKNLTKEINHHNNLYYNKDNPEISDFEYDMLFNELKNLEEKYPQFKFKDSPTQKIGGKALSTFEKVQHKVYMGSLQNAYSFEELLKFEERVKQKIENIEYIIEPKVDGLSVSLEYENGKFKRGSTRGDGFEGEDVTENLKTINTIPKTLNKSIPFLEVRAEIYMPIKKFEELILEQKKSGETPFKNPRNAAAGSLRQKNAFITSTRGLKAICFNIQQIEGFKIETHSNAIELLTNLGFYTIPESIIFKNMRDCKAKIEEIKNNEKYYDFEIDGAVVKINSIKDREILGSTAKNPRWAIAFKYPPEEVKTTIIDIIIQVGRTGVLTPIAVFNPVNVAKTTINKASLHNQDYIDKKDIRIGDVVTIRKAGEIIPEVVKSIEHKKGSTTFKLPNICPACESEVVRVKSFIRCVNPSCPATKLQNIIHFVSKNAMNIKDLGEETIKILVEKGIIKDVADLYTLKEEDILSLDENGEKEIFDIFIKEKIMNEFLDFYILNFIKELEKELIEFLVKEKIIKNISDLYMLKDIRKYIKDLKQETIKILVKEKIVKNISDFYILKNLEIFKKETIEFLVNKKAIKNIPDIFILKNVKDLKEGDILKLFEKKIIKNISDIYNLKKEDILKLNNFSAKNIITDINKYKKNPATSKEIFNNKYIEKETIELLIKENIITNYSDFYILENIETIDKEIIKFLVKEEIIKNISDLYMLKDIKEYIKEKLNKETIEILVKGKIIKNISDFYILKNTEVLKEKEKAIRNLVEKKIIKDISDIYILKNINSITKIKEEDIKNLVKEKIIKDISDLYKLKDKEILRTKGFIFKKKSAKNIINSINISKKNPCWRLLFGLGIREVGQKTAKIICEKYKSIFEIMTKKVEDLIEIEDIGETIALNITKYFSFKETKNLIDRLKKYGVNLDDSKKTNIKGIALKNISFVITGKFENLSREDLKNLIEENSGKVLSAISSKTNYLIAGKKAGSKLEKAKKLNIKIINKEEFLNLIK